MREKLRWREFRNLTQSDLARSSGVNRIQIVDIEAGRNTEHHGINRYVPLRRLAAALAVSVDDLIPAPDSDT